jgi:hypothetical protein
VADSLAAIQARTFAHATPATKGSYPPESRLTEHQLRDFLDRRAFAVVATSRPDGRPHTAISSFACAGTTFWLPTGSGTVRERNVSAQPWVSLVITEGDRGEHIVVIAEGEAEMVPAAQVPPEIRDAGNGHWATQWLCVPVTRLLSYASDGARIAHD